MEWIKTFPCIVCGKYPTDAAHTGDRAYGRKAPDKTCLPICDEHHRPGYPESHHTLGKRFWAHHNIDRDQKIAHFNKLWEEKQAA